MRKPLLTLLLMILGFFLPATKALAYGPFVLPIHDNGVEINGGAWNYSLNCSVAEFEAAYPYSAVHGGFDFDGDEGDNVYASASGTVSDVKNSNCPNTYPNGDRTWGCYVDIDHDVDGDGIPDYTTKYTHLVSGSITVAIGNSVSSNTLIGQLGNSGYSDGAHLHYGVQDWGDCQSLEHSCWLNPYNLNDNATCCDIPNGCPNEGTSSQHSDFDCDAATDSDYLWASCPPTYNAEVSTCTSDVYTIHLLTVTANASTHTFTIKPYYHTGSGNSVSLNLPDSSYTMTGLGNTNNVNTWLVGDLDNDGNDDIVNVTDTGSYTYVQVYVSNGDGTFVGRDRWLKANNGYSHAFLTDMDNDDDLDLVLGYPNGSSIKWRIGTNIGSDFADLTTWSESFGSTDSHFLVGDFNGNGKGEVLAGTTNSGGVELGWQRLDTTGNSATIATGWGTSSNTYLVSDVNYDGRDDFLRIDETNSTVEAYLAQYSSTIQWLSVSTMANDVGGTDGDYFVYPLDYNDDYPDLLRLNSSGTLYLGQHTSATTFEEQGDQQDIVSNLPTDGTLLFGNFGGLQSDCIAPYSYVEVADGDLDVDPGSFTYTSQVLTNLASVDYADLSSSVTCAVDEADSLYVVLNGQDGRIYEFESTDDGITWTSTHLTSVAAVPLSAPGTTPHLFIDPDTGDRYVAFTGVNARINLFHYNGTSWSAVELTSVVAAPLADLTSSPFGYIANGVIYVVFQGDDQRIWRFSVTNGSSYGSLDLTGRASVQYAMPGTSPMAVYNDLTGEHHIVFQGINQRIQRLTYNGSTWSSVEITSVVNSDLLDSASSPMTYVDPFTGYVYTVINGVNERIDLIADYHNNSWGSDELTSIVSVPLTEPGSSPTGYIDPFTGNHVITFQGDNGRINQFEGPDMTAPVDWTGIDQTSQAAVEFAASGTSPATCVDSFTGVRHTLFVGDNGRVQYLRLGP